MFWLLPSVPPLDKYLLFNQTHTRNSDARDQRVRSGRRIKSNTGEDECKMSESKNGEED